MGSFSSGTKASDHHAPAKLPTDLSKLAVRLRRFPDVRSYASNDHLSASKPALEIAKRSTYRPTNRAALNRCRDWWKFSLAQSSASLRLANLKKASRRHALHLSAR